MPVQQKEEKALELEKLREEIRSSRLQRKLAIWGMIGTLFTGAIPYAKWAFEKFSQAQLVLKLDSALSRSRVQVRLEGEAGVMHRYPAGSLPPTLRLPAGAYQVSVFEGDDSLTGAHLILESRQRKELALSSPFQGGFHLRARLAQKSIHPGTNLRLTVESSESGFLWIYEITDGTPKLLLPEDGRGLPLEAGKEFFLPDGNLNLVAGAKSGQEILLFVATRENDKAIADQLGLSMAQGVVSKAVATPAVPDAGVYVMQYSINM